MISESNSSILAELRPFFYPRSIAVVGVSKNPAGVGTSMVRALRRFGFSGKIYPVNPRLTEVFGLQVYPSISKIPGNVDFARVYVPTAAVFDVIGECRQKGIKAVEVFTGGFGETGTDKGRQLEAELAALAGDGMRIIGPNCFGVYSPAGGVTQIPGENYQQESGSLGFLSQSGGLSEDVFRYAVDYGIKFSQGISYGNAGDVNEVDLLRYFEADPNTCIVSAYVEGVKHGIQFLDVTRRLALKKPLIMWKGGLTPGGARVAATHTGSLSGSEKVWSAIFRQTCAVQVHSVEELLETASAFYRFPFHVDNRIAVVCGGGGIGVAFSDSCHREGLRMAELSREVQAKIANFLAPLGTSSRNPIDVGPPFPPGEVLEAILETLASSGQVGNIVLDKVTPSVRMRSVMGYTEQIAWEDKSGLSEIPVRIMKKYGIPIIVILREGGDKPGSLECEEERKRLRNYYLENGVCVFSTQDRAVRSLRRMVNYYQRRQAASENK